jgi:peptidoglycan/LPS O-acetylase OafA/YrhL
MGLLRFLLALSVIVAHCGPVFGVKFSSGEIAVEAFFIISGFYMALTLTEKYFKAPNYYRLFITNRLLRLYPMYWAMLILIFFADLVHGYFNGQYGNLQVFIDEYPNLKFGTLLYLILINITVLGQDTVYFFTGNSTGGLSFLNNAAPHGLVLYRFILDLPLWTVSLEIIFYIISPVFVRLKLKPLVIILVIMLIARSVFKIQTVRFDPFVYRLFLLQLPFFLAGIVAYKFYIYLKNKHIPKAVFYILIGYLGLFTIFAQNLPNTGAKDFIYLASIFCAVPVLFVFSKNSKTDRWIGELSYPMYISHMLMILTLENILPRLHINLKYLGLISIASTICLSIALIYIIGKRLEAYRARRVKRQVSTITQDIYGEKIIG